jgi:hypothetical protein
LHLSNGSKNGGNFIIWHCISCNPANGRVDFVNGSHTYKAGKLTKIKALGRGKW